MVLALALTSCQWTTARFSANGSGHNTSESTIGLDDLGDLTLDVRGNFGDGSTTEFVPVVGGDAVFISTSSGSGRLLAFSVSGAGCADPLACDPLWTSASYGAFQQATVAGGRVVVTVGDDLQAYDAAGVEGCSGTPKVCAPVWTAPGWGAPWNLPPYGGPVAAGGIVFVSTYGMVGAFDPAGIQGCTGAPRVCQPIRTYPGASFWSPYVVPALPSVADGKLFVASGEDVSSVGELAVYDATGTQGCSGVPVVCSPLWSAAVPGVVGNPPAVVDGVAYVGYGAWYEFEESEGPVYSGRAGVVAFDVADCAVAVRCTPSWQGVVHNSYQPRAATGVAVADGFVHVASAGSMATFAVGGGGACLPLCQPQWRAAVGYGSRVSANPTIANGVVYVNGRAFDAAGVVGCSGTTVVCQPQWSEGPYTTPVVVSNGKVIVVGSGTVRIYGLD